MLGWALWAFVLLGGTAIFGTLFSITYHGEFSGVLWYLLTALCGLVGVPVTLVAVILGVVRASRNHQWRWLAAILIGTVLPLPVAVAVSSAVYSVSYDYNQLQMSFPWAFGVVCMPLAVALYTVVGLRSSPAGAPVPGQSAAYADTRAWLGGVGTVTALALTLVASSLASSWLPPGAPPAPPGAPVLTIQAYHQQYQGGPPLNGPVDCKDGFQNLDSTQQVDINISNPGGGLLRWAAHTDDPAVQIDPSRGFLYGSAVVYGPPQEGYVFAVDATLIGASQQRAVTINVQSNAGDAHLVVQCMA